MLFHDIKLLISIKILF